MYRTTLRPRHRVSEKSLQNMAMAADHNSCTILISCACLLGLLGAVLGQVEQGTVSGDSAALGMGQSANIVTPTNEPGPAGFHVGPVVL